ncbi:tyrosine-type recombinase/integrase [Planomonospora parontospora]|uniref:tyrosine-type recombinase/integrase n=1 Tax=Planomonospora parontospora TaxID=58119 RepID=UPI00166F668A|nr:tyrosine-type recombinase/integrase [Planomonospora parontospora]GGL42653.1 site-specific integrase [Planomonospora parontospora subsp. antibiotica]GII18364.1 site-specific integrase [Planomonospora parontospora subsp. antibiotica]
MANGTTYKTCGCRDEATGKQLGKQCPKLRRPGGRGDWWSSTHGRWAYQLELPAHADGRRRTPLRRSGFATLEEAEAELDHARGLLALDEDPQVRRQITELILVTLKETRALPPTEEVRRKVRTRQDLNQQISVAEWLEEFLKRKRRIDATTRRAYESHIRLYLNPYLGHIRLDRLRVSDIAGMFDAIEEFNDVITNARASGDTEQRAKVKYRRPVGPATMHRIRATLRHALNIAIKQDRLIDFNPAAAVELPDAVRPKALVWTEERVAQWITDAEEEFATERRRCEGYRVNVIGVYIATPRPSPVMVWTPAQTSVFLTYAQRHRLHALYRLIALRGLRRGEAVGLRWKDVDFTAGTVGVHWQITQLGWEAVQGKPKTDASDRVIALDAETLKVLKAHRKRQAAERLTAGEVWIDSGFVFTDERGQPLHPQHATDQFYWLAYQAGLPPVRLHDLRHGAASLMLAAGVELKVVQETLGHVSSAFTRDTYTSVYPEVAQAAAESTAALITADPAMPKVRLAMLPTAARGIRS